MPLDQPLLSFSRLSLARNGHSVLDRVSFELGRGETLGWWANRAPASRPSPWSRWACSARRPSTVEGSMAFADHETC